MTFKGPFHSVILWFRKENRLKPCWWRYFPRTRLGQCGDEGRWRAKRLYAASGQVLYRKISRAIIGLFSSQLFAKVQPKPPGQDLGEAQRPSRFPTTGLNLMQAKQFSILKKHRKMRSQTFADLQTFVASSWWCKQAQVQALGHFWSLQDFPLGAEHTPPQVS